MPVTFIGVRHHSPACARLVGDTIARLAPAYVLIEGPVDMNDRLDELLLDHDLPVAIFTSYRDDTSRQASWSPFCAHAPEWVALTEGRRVGADVRFIDLPAWHPAFSDVSNRYADAERRHMAAVERLCARLSVDNIDALWDHLFEIPESDDLQEQLVAYFDLVRGDADASARDTERETYMARWVEAADRAAGDRHVVVVTGGFHRPALVARHAAQDASRAAAAEWPDIPQFPESAVGGSYLVPFSFRRLDAFDGYQSGMPSPHYYQRLWEDGPEAAAVDIVASVADRLRARHQPVSTADLIAARTMSLGLARLRGHDAPGRTDVLDGLVAALVSDALDRPAPWSGRGRLEAGTDPVIVEMVAALSGDTVGRLDPRTPHPPLVHDVTAEFERHGVPAEGVIALSIATPDGLERSRTLHRARVLGLPGLRRERGPAPGAAPVLDEVWHRVESDQWLPAVIEAGSYGATLLDATAAALTDRFAATGADAAALADLLFDSVLCGLDAVTGEVVTQVERMVRDVTDVGALGLLLATTLGLWRHDRSSGARGHPALARIVAGGVERALWLIETIRGGDAPADLGLVGAIVAVRDAAVHPAGVLPLDVGDVAAVFERATDIDRPPALRGAALGFLWSTNHAAADSAAVEHSVRRAATPTAFGDFLSGLFALSRERLLDEDGASLVGVLDERLAGMADDAFLVALPALRQAFGWFPPRERELIANGLLDRRGATVGGTGMARAAALLTLPTDPGAIARARSIEATVDRLLAEDHLLGSAP